MIKKRDAAKALAKTIDERTTEVRDALFDSGVRITPNADKSDLVASILQNIGSNRRLQTKIGKLAIEVNPQAFQAYTQPKRRRSARNMTGFFGQSGQQGNGQVGQQAIETGGQIVGILIANALANRQAQKQAQLDAQAAETQEKLLLANQQLVEANLALEQTKLAQASFMTPTSKILIGVLVIGALGAGFYFMQKNQASAGAPVASA